MNEIIDMKEILRLALSEVAPKRYSCVSHNEYISGRSKIIGKQRNHKPIYNKKGEVMK